MTRTVIESKTKTTVIGFDEPFCVIGERINPTGRKILNEELERGDFTRVQADAIAQAAAGAAVLDINSGAVFSNKMAEDPRYADNNFVEPMLMPEMIRVVQKAVDTPICIDSSVPGALEAGLEACEGRPLLNSVTGEEERLELVLPLGPNWPPTRPPTPISTLKASISSPWGASRQMHNGRSNTGAHPAAPPIKSERPQL